MKHLILILMVTALCCSGCTSTRSYMPQGEQLVRQFEAGDRIRVYQRNGDIADLQLVSLNQQQLVGRSLNAPFQNLEVPVLDISLIEKEEVTAMTRIGVVGALAVIVPTAIIAGSVGVDWE